MVVNISLLISKTSAGKQTQWKSVEGGRRREQARYNLHVQNLRHSIAFGSFVAR